MIDSFSGEYDFLSNFYDAPVEYNGIIYKNSEAAFQAQKTLSEDIRKEFAELPPGKAKRRGRELELRNDWEDVRVSIMYGICRNKFAQNPDIREKLFATGDEKLVEGNTWNDTFWGVCNGTGKNMLGLILMRVREELRHWYT